MPTAFELELDDTSPVVNYFPFAETLGAPDFLAGWNSFFSDSGFLTELGQIGQGTSLHVTSLDGAALTIEWVGTGISLFGSAFKAAYTLSLDGGEPSLGLPTGELLGAYQGLEQKQHTIALIAHPNASLINPDSYVAFDRALLNATVDHTAYVPPVSRVITV
ncbi:hypothetical protein K439DRAFT_1334800 [Ramaria rubella]|nr:hypothetical protein K439DRAFT_1334800 [Ramaria rubella]